MFKKDESTGAGFEFVHPIREEPWKQLVFRFYDYDQNIVTIAEYREEATMRLFRERHTSDAIANMTGLPVDEVEGEEN